MNGQERLLTERQAAELLAVSPTTLATWRSRRRYTLPFVRLGSARAIRYRLSDVKRFMEEGLVVDRTVIDQKIRNECDRLSEREIEILSRRACSEDAPSKTLGEVARELGISRERVRQIELEALRKLIRRALRECGVVGF